MAPGPDVPLILNGYGGFAITETPVWSPQIAAWCAAGGVYAIAGLRGGLEEGEAWHHAGRREHKQNVFDDFHAAADWLVAEGLAGRERLAILGRSNGGLLVGAALTQRPDLCRAVWCGVPLLDMIRFPQFLIARLWTDEYGDPDVAEDFAWLHAYSPYHHVVEGTAYPATLFSTAEGDTRVDPLHARKMAALLQAASSGQDERPILLYQEGRAGHGVGKPVAKRADELADGLTFLAWQVGLVVPEAALTVVTHAGRVAHRRRAGRAVGAPRPRRRTTASSRCSAPASGSSPTPGRGSSAGRCPVWPSRSPRSTGSRPPPSRRCRRSTSSIRPARSASTTS